MATLNTGLVGVFWAVVPGSLGQFHETLWFLGLVVLGCVSLFYSDTKKSKISSRSFFTDGQISKYTAFHCLID